MTPGGLAKKVSMLFLCCLLATGARAAPTVSESELKAAYLYNFALFTTWPADKLAEDGSAMVFCVIGQDPLAASMGGLQSRKIRDRRIVVKQVVAPEEGRGCHVLYLGAGGFEAMPAMLEAVRDSGTLTVTDTLDPLRREMVINMLVENGRLAFDVNLSSARRAGLILSSKLLNLARSVN